MYVCMGHDFAAVGHSGGGLDPDANYLDWVVSGAVLWRNDIYMAFYGNFLGLGCCQI